MNLIPQIGEVLYCNGSGKPYFKRYIGPMAPDGGSFYQVAVSFLVIVSPSWPGWAVAATRIPKDR